MVYLLDTDTLVHMIRGLKQAARQPARANAERLVTHCRHAKDAGNSVGLSAVTVSELEFGARKSRSYEDEMAAVRKVLAPFDLYEYDVVQCPVHYGRLRFELEERGEKFGAMDLLIAAHALALDAVLVTNNLRHYNRVAGLKTRSWL